MNLLICMNKSLLKLTHFYIKLHFNWNLGINEIRWIFVTFLAHTYVFVCRKFLIWFFAFADLLAALKVFSFELTAHKTRSPNHFYVLRCLWHATPTFFTFYLTIWICYLAAIMRRSHMHIYIRVSQQPSNSWGKHKLG